MRSPLRAFAPVVSEATAPAVDKATAIVRDAAGQWTPVRDAAADATAAVREALTDGTASLGAAATGLADQMRESAAGLRDQFSAQAGSATNFAQEKVTDIRNRAADLAERAPAAAGDVIARNAPLIGALGLAIGAIIAAALPATRAENVTLGKARDRAQGMATDALELGFATAKSAVLSAADAATQSVKDAGLDDHVSRVTHDMGEKLKSVAEDAVTTAFEPSHPIDAERTP